MAAPAATIWDLEPHTRAKHEILRRYLQAWTPILSRGGFRQMLYVDGFAGPGQYSKGEVGSPVIALQAAIEANVPAACTALYFFVELDRARADSLNSIVGAIKCPTNVRAKVAGGETFEAAFESLTKFYAGKGGLPPTFAFIDPFGWVGVPFAIVREIMAKEHCEVLVTFMYEEINRFIGHKDQVANFDAYFGCPEWRGIVDLADAAARNRRLHDLYLRQLRTDRTAGGAGARFVRSFEMRNDNDVTDYFLFHATNSLLGLKRMKEAMWKVDPAGEFRFSDATNPAQLVLFGKNPALEILRAQVLARFAGREATLAEVEEFVVAETAFRETHYKRQILKALEDATPPLMTVVSEVPGRRRGTYPDPSLRLRFA